MSSRPSFDTDDAVRLARELWGINARAIELTSDSDRNFRLEEIETEKVETGERSVLKIANPRHDEALLEAENLIFRQIEERDPALPCPRILPSLNGNDLEIAADRNGIRHVVRRISWLDGRPLAKVVSSDALLRDLGRKLGRLGNALDEIDCEAADRELSWDLAHAPELIADRISAIENGARRRLVERVVEEYCNHYRDRLEATRRTLLHNDANDYNILVDARAGEGSNGSERWAPTTVTALLDFGDLVNSYAVCEPAVALTYLLLDDSHIVGMGGDKALADVVPFVSAYHSARPLEEDEISLLFPLVLLRLSLSVTMSAHQRPLEPDNEYLSISEKPAWRALARLSDLHPRRVEWLFRQACELEPCPGSERVVDAIRATEAAPILGFALTSQNTHVLDSSIASPLFSSLEKLAPAREEATDGEATEEAAKNSISRKSISRKSVSTYVLTEEVRRQGKRVGWGRYDEARPFYNAPQFEARGQTARTVHLGVDLACEPETEVIAPLDGVVHSVADNNQPGDYGPTVLLEHRLPAPLIPSKAVTFWTLYGHLHRESIAHHKPGQQIPRGERLATVGHPYENGGWWPHLHFQLIVDTLENEGDFPGVAPADERQSWLSVSPDPNHLLRFSDSGLEARGHNEGLRERRHRLLGRSLSLSYSEPLEIVRGEGAWLFDSSGRRYLDLVNNVCHVGHCHPEVTNAVNRQAALLNTNTRYLHDNILDYAERLLATFPDPLDVCFFVNSGSEANDLALRLARTATGRQDVLCLEGAYHGHLTSLIEVSPTKHDGPGGAGTPKHVFKASMPDGYRGRYRHCDLGDQVAARYVAEIEELAQESATEGTGLAAFIAEPLLSCGGQVVLPPGYLDAAFATVRRAGGLCIADEVQVGFGRVGSHFWSFQAQGVTPDIVTLGKPIGNGHPLAAVITTRSIAEAFANGMEYFNTYGGNPVSCAAGLAVLEVIEKEGLQQHALELGKHLLASFEELKENHDAIGDVRGQGLFLGIELVDTRKTDTQKIEPRKKGTERPRPDADLATFIVEQMKRRGFLLSADGPDHNVIKIKPPLVVTREETDRFVYNLSQLLDKIKRASAG